MRLVLWMCSVYLGHHIRPDMDTNMTLVWFMVGTFWWAVIGDIVEMRKK